MRIARSVARAILLLYALAVVFTECAPTTAVADPTLARIRTNGQLRVGYDPGSFPFTTSSDGQPAGYDIDLGRALGQAIGVPVLFVPTGLDAAYDELQQGHFDLIASAMPYAPEQGWRPSTTTTGSSHWPARPATIQRSPTTCRSEWYWGLTATPICAVAPGQASPR